MYVHMHITDLGIFSYILFFWKTRQNEAQNNCLQLVLLPSDLRLVDFDNEQSGLRLDLVCYLNQFSEKEKSLKTKRNKAEGASLHGNTEFPNLVLLGPVPLCLSPPCKEKPNFFAPEACRVASSTPSSTMAPTRS